MTVTKHNFPQLNDEVAADIRKYARNRVTGDKLQHSMVATMQLAGFKSTDCISPDSNGSTATRETFDFIKAAIMSGFPKGVPELCAMTAKAAGDKVIDGRNRSYWSKQPNSIVAAIGRAIRIKEEIDAEIEAGNAAPDTRTRTPAMMVRDNLAECVKRIQKAETFTCTMDIDDLVQNLNALIKTIG